MTPETTSSPMRVLIVDDNPDIARIMGFGIDDEPDMQCAGTLSSADQLEDVVFAEQADIVLLDLSMPGIDPMEALKGLVRSGARAKVLVLSGRDDPETITRALEAGARGFLSKDARLDEIVAGIRKVMAGEIVLRRPGW